MPTKLTLSQCYNSDGTPSSDVPCDPEALVSACCSNRNFCATNLFCLDGKGKRLTGTCTEQNWGTANPVECPCSSSHSVFDFESNITQCVNGIYCCGSGNQSCCDHGQGRLSVVYDAFAATYSNIPTSLAAIPSISSTIVTSISEGLTHPSTSIQLTVSSLGQNSTLPSTAPSSTTSSEGGGGDGLGQMGIGIALGLGTPLLLILGACAFLFVRLRETRLQIKEVDGPIVLAKRSINTLREKRSMATLNEDDSKWL